MVCGVKFVGSESWSVLIPSSVSFKHLSAGLILCSECESLYWPDNESRHKQCDRTYTSPQCIETRFYCPQTFLYLDFQCGDGLKLKQMFQD